MLDNKCFICDSIALRASNLVVVLRGIFEIIFVCMMPSKININFNHVHERRFFARNILSVIAFLKTFDSLSDMLAYYGFRTNKRLHVESLKLHILLYLQFLHVNTIGILCTLT